jgi:hypothetical protein
VSVWITYTVKYGGGHQMDREPNTYRNVAIFDNELAALRFANKHGCKVVEIVPGETLEQAIDQAMANDRARKA